MVCFRGHVWDGAARPSGEAYCRACARMLEERRRDKLRAIREQYRAPSAKRVRIRCK